MIKNEFKEKEKSVVVFLCVREFHSKVSWKVRNSPKWTTLHNLWVWVEPLSVRSALFWTCKVQDLPHSGSLCGAVLLVFKEHLRNHIVALLLWFTAIWWLIPCLHSVAVNTLAWQEKGCWFTSRDCVRRGILLWWTFVTREQLKVAWWVAHLKGQKEPATNYTVVELTIFFRMALWEMLHVTEMTEAILFLIYTLFNWQLFQCYLWLIASPS